MSTSYVYGLYDISGTCLYVGQSIKPRARLWARLWAHRRNGHFRELPCVMRVLRACDSDEVNRLEVQIMLAYRRRGEAKMNRTLKAFGRPLMPDELKASDQIQARITLKRKAAYFAAAKAEGLTLADWCFKHLDKASGGSGLLWKRPRK